MCSHSVSCKQILMCRVCPLLRCKYSHRGFLPKLPCDVTEQRQKREASYLSPAPGSRFYTPLGSSAHADPGLWLMLSFGLQSANRYLLSSYCTVNTKRQRYATFVGQIGEEKINITPRSRGTPKIHHGHRG